MDLYKPYVDGLDNLPADGRFLLVGNHTQFGLNEIVLIPYFVRKTIGTQVRPLADRQLARNGRPAPLFTAYGAVVGSPENASDLMRADETILVFPGGGREMPKFKGEEYTLRWHNRYGFARCAVEHDYPIVPAALVGGDDVLSSFVARDSRWGQVSEWMSERLTGRKDMAFPPLHGIGPTLIPRPRRSYLRFGAPIATTRPERASEQEWVAAVKERVQTELQSTLSDLQGIRDDDPYRELNPLAWRSAVMAPDTRNAG
ncbi:lysophospholipid acyltransferase family protein [Mycobacterium sp. AT1]|uniref:lysophospholipid acyltransferase family protein n=1 Tax=Mycobacterium sp. AT1 TaxID=1961706 RepID=UPI0035195917